MLISVIICTRNRAELLSRALASVVDQDFPSRDYEVIVVDNDSSDHTAEVAKRYADRANVRYLRELQIGLCMARNAGWRAASGQYVAYFDDDALAAPGWLAAVADGFAGTWQNVGVVGGRVDPLWEEQRPAWLSDEVAHALTIVDWSTSDKYIEDVGREWLVGANMAVPRSVLAEVGGFHPWLDRVGANLLSSGDVHLQKEVIKRGYRCLYRPSMTIHHLVPASRLSQQWFLRRHYWQGVSDAVMYLIDNSPSQAERIGLAIARAGGLPGLSDPASLVPGPAGKPSAFTDKCFALINVGFISGILGAAGH